MTIYIVMLGFLCANAVFAIWLTRSLLNFLTLGLVAITLIWVGTAIQEQGFYSSHLASFCLVAFACFLNIGAFLARMLDGNSLGPLNTEQLPKVSGRKTNFAVLALALLACCAIALVFFLLNGVPLLEKNLYFARKSAQIGAGAYYRVFLFAMPILSAIAVACYCIYKSIYYKILAVAFCAVTLLTVVMLGYKGYAIWFVLLLCMVLNVYISNSRLIKWSSILFLCFAIPAALLVTSLTYESSLLKSLLILVVRATVVASSGFTTLIYEYLPSMPLDAPIPDDFQTFLSGWKFGWSSEMAENAMELTITAVGAGFLFFGNIGLVLVPLGIGFVGYLSSSFAIRHCRSPLIFVTFIYIPYAFVGLIVRGYFENFFRFSVASVFIVATAYCVACVILNKRFTFPLGRFNRVNY